MCSSPDMPDPPPPPPPPPEAPNRANKDVQSAYDNARKRAAKPRGTLLTGTEGVTSTASTGKTYLGG